MRNLLGSKAAQCLRQACCQMTCISSLVLLLIISDTHLMKQPLHEHQARLEMSQTRGDRFYWQNKEQVA